MNTQANEQQTPEAATPAKDEMRRRGWRVHQSDASDVQAQARAMAGTIKFSDISSENIHIFLAAVGVEVRYNLLSLYVEARGLGSGNHAYWQVLSAENNELLWGDIFEASSQEYPKVRRSYIPDKQKDAIILAYITASDLAINPVRDWLDNDSREASKTQPNYNPLEMLWNIERPKGVDKKDWDEWVFRLAWFPFVAAVAYAYEGNTPYVRLCPIYVGETQEIGKSSWLTAALPDEMSGEWNTELVIKSGNDAMRDMVEQCAGRVFVEVSEILGWGAKSREQWKSFISTTHHNIIRKHQKKPTMFPHTWMVYMTTNQLSSLPFDTSGYSRFLVAHLFPKAEWLEDESRLSKMDELCREHLGFGHEGNYGLMVVALVKSMRNKLWSDAKYLYKKYGLSFLMLPQKLKEIQELVATGHAAQSEYDLVLSDLLHVEGQEPFGKLVAFTKTDLARAARMADLSEPTSRSERHFFLDRQIEMHGFVPLRYDSTNRVRMMGVKYWKPKNEQDFGQPLKPGKARRPIFYAPSREEDAGKAVSAAEAFSNQVFAVLDSGETQDVESGGDSSTSSTNEIKQADYGEYEHTNDAEEPF